MKTKYLVLGATGGIGYGLVKALVKQNHSTTILVRDYQRAVQLFGSHPELEIVVGDATNSKLLNELSQDKTHIFHGLNASYEKWKTFLPRITRNLIAAASQNQATLILPANNYNYGNASEPITEITPFQPNTELGKVRVEIEHLIRDAVKQGIIRGIIVRLPEVWGPNVTNKAFKPVFVNAIKGKTIPWLYTIDVPQQMVFNLDAGRVILQICEQGDGAKDWMVFNYAGDLHLSMWHFFKSLTNSIGQELKTKVVGKAVVNVLSYLNPTIKAIKSLAYKYENTILLDDAKFKKAFPQFEATPHEEAVQETLRWFEKEVVDPEQKQKKRSRRAFWIDFLADNLSIGIFPMLIALLTMAVPGIQSMAVLFGVVAGIYWVPLTRNAFRKLFAYN